MLFEILRRVVAESLLDLFREPIQILIALNVEARKNLYQLEDIGHQRMRGSGTRVRSSRFTMWETTSRNRFHRSSVPRASDWRTFASISRETRDLLLRRHLHPEVCTRGNG